MADGKLIFDTEINKSGFETGISKLGNLAKQGMSAVEGSFSSVDSEIDKLTDSASELGEELKNSGNLAQIGMKTAETAFSSAEAEIDKLGDSASELGEELKNSGSLAEAGMEAVENAVKSAEKKLERFSETIEDTGDEFRDSGKIAEKSLSDVEDAVNSAEKELDEMGDSSSDLGKEIESSMEKAENAVEDFADEVEENDNVEIDVDVSGFKNKMDKLGSIAKTGIEAVTKIIASAGAGVLALGGYATEVGKNFESGMSQVAATMGITKDTVEGGINSYELLKNAAADAGEQTTFSATEASEALNYLALAGYDAVTAADALPAVLNLAAAGGLELQYAADLATDAMGALGITANSTNLTEFGDKMAKAAQKSNTSVAQLGEAILTVGGTAKELAGGTTELNAALGVLANVGIKGSEGGTALRNIMLAMTPTTDKAAWAFDRLNLSAYDADGNLRPLNETFRDMSKAMEGMSSQEKTDILNNMFNKVDLKSVSAMLAACASSTDELGTAFIAAGIPADNISTFLDNFNNKLYNSMTAEEFAASVMNDFGISAEEAAVIYDSFTAQLNGITFDNLYNEIAECDGAMSEMGHTMNDTLDGDIKSLQSKIEAFGIAVYEDLNLPLRELAQSGGEYISQLTAAFREGSFEGLAESIGDVLSQAITQLTGYIPKVTELAGDIIVNLAEGLVSNAEIITESAFEVISKITDVIFNLVPNLNECAYIIINNLAEGLTESAPSLVNSFVLMTNEVWNGLTDELPIFMEIGLQLVEAIADSIFDNIPIMIDTALQLVSKLCDFLIQSVPLILNAAIQLFMGIIGAFPKVVTALKKELPTLLETIKSVIPQLGEAVTEAVPEIINAISEGLPIIIDALAEMLPEIITAVIDFLFSSSAQLLDVSVEVLSALVEAVPLITEALISQLPAIITAITVTLLKAVPQITEASLTLLMEIVKAIPTVIGELAGGMGEILAVIVLGLGKIFSDAWNSIVEFFANAHAETKQKASELISGIMEFISELPGKIGETLGYALGTIIKWGIEAPEKARETGRKFLENVREFFSKLPENIGNFIDKAIDKITDWGKNLASKGKEAAKKLSDAVVNGITSLPDKMADAGNNLVHGLWNGITGARNWLKGKISDFGNGIIDGFKEAFGIHSPSTLMRDEVGKYIAEGVGVGFTEEMPSIGEEITDKLSEIDIPKLSIEYEEIEIPEAPPLIFETKFPEIELPEYDPYDDYPKYPPVRITDDAVQRLNEQSININNTFVPSSVSEIVNNTYSYSTVNNSGTDNSDGSETIVINAKFDIDGETIAEGVGEIVADKIDRQQGVTVQLRKRGVAT